MIWYKKADYLSSLIREKEGNTEVWEWRQRQRQRQSRAVLESEGGVVEAAVQWA